MAYQRITRDGLIDRWNKVMQQIGHNHFCVPCSEFSIKDYKDMVHYSQIVYDGFDDDFKDGYDDKRRFHQDKAKVQRLCDWLRNAPIDDDVKHEPLFGTKGRGGYRPNAGRKNTGRERRLHIRISEEAFNKLQNLEKVSYSEAIDRLIRKYLRFIK